MPERTTLLPGSFCWPELATPDIEKAKAFYADLFGWTGVDVPSAGGNYSLLKLRDLDVAGARTLSAHEREHGVASHFMTYISTASADASAAKLAELGGKVLAGPFDVEGIGRMCIAVDPGGVPFALWEARGHIGARLVGEESSLCWTELVTKDAATAQAFYAGLFGWTFTRSTTSPAPYFEIHRGDQIIGGVLAMEGEGWAHVPPHWMPYFAVGNCDAIVDKVHELGGSAVVPPTDIPTVGRFALVKDNQGAHLSVISWTALTASA